MHVPPSLGAAAASSRAPGRRGREASALLPRAASEGGEAVPAAAYSSSSSESDVLCCSCLHRLRLVCCSITCPCPTTTCAPNRLCYISDIFFDRMQEAKLISPGSGDSDIQTLVLVVD